MSTTKNILVTGSNGQLGNELKSLQSKYPQYNFTFYSREELNISDPKAIEENFEKTSPHFVINCAAYTAVDKAETEHDTAMMINGSAVGYLAAACNKNGAKFIHISTDYVFDGQSKAPLKETDDVHPVNFYGESKLLGERLAFKHNEDSVVIRTSWVYSVFGNNFVKTMIRLMQSRESISVVNDQIGSPTYAADLAEVIMQIIDADKWVAGVFHFSNDGVISWYEFAQEIKTLTGSNCMVNGIPTEQYPTPAKRPTYSVMDKSKIVETYNVALKNWRESLQRCIALLKDDQHNH